MAIAPVSSETTTQKHWRTRSVMPIAALCLVPISREAARSEMGKITPAAIIRSSRIKIAPSWRRVEVWKIVCSNSLDTTALRRTPGTEKSRSSIGSPVSKIISAPVRFWDSSITASVISSTTESVFTWTRRVVSGWSKEKISPLPNLSKKRRNSGCRITAIATATPTKSLSNTKLSSLKPKRSLRIFINSSKMIPRTISRVRRSLDRDSTK